MKRLIIRNLGPVKSVDIELNKVNLIIGPQSSGKSTVNKVACFCSWLEKEISISQENSIFNPERVFSNRLIAFHKLEGFICEQTYIYYESDVLKFSFEDGGKKFLCEWSNRWNYKRHKTSYIPAERNIVATIPNWFDVKLKNNSIRSFMSAWEEARNYFQTDQKLEILNLGINYYFDKDERNDLIKIEANKSLDFTNTSSGLQSLVPLFVVLRYITQELYTQKQDEDSIENISITKNFVKSLYKVFKEKGKTEAIRDEKGKLNGYIDRIEGEGYLFSNTAFAKEFDELYANYAYIQGTNIFIEEPEENLFPATQRDLMYAMMQVITANPEHNLFLTTHSPFILYALNNSMLAYQVREKVDGQTQKLLPCLSACIDPDMVSLWQMKDGQLLSIKNEDTQSLGSHYFNDNMNEILNEYYIMTNYL